MAPLSGAERAKRFREKNKTRVTEQNALRKRHKRLMMKVNNPVKNEETLRRERLYKQDYRMRKKDIQQQQLLTERHSERDEATPSTSSSSEGEKLSRLSRKALGNKKLLLPVWRRNLT